MSEYTASSRANRHPAMPDLDLTEADCEPSDTPPNNGWWCFKCRTKHRHGDPLDGCPDCGHLLGEDPR